MPVPPKYADLQIYFQCRIPGCSARCAVSPKHSGRLGDHWKKQHITEHGAFNGREVLVKTRNADATFSTTTFDAYATANGIKYKTQDSPRPTRHANSSTTISSSTTRSSSSGGPMQVNSTAPAAPSMTSATATATAQPTSNLRRIARMERQLRIASMPSCRPQESQGEPNDRDTLDSHPNQRLPQCSASTRLPLKRNLSQAFREAKSNPTQAISSTNLTANASFNIPSLPAAAAAAPKIPFSQLLISHLLSPAPPIRTAINATQALRGTISLPTRVSDGQPKDYSHNTWSCEMCHIDFPDMRGVTEHLRDHHAVEDDVVTLTPERDVITMVLASVRVDDAEHGWVDGEGEAVGELGTTKREEDETKTETDEEVQGE